MRTLTVRGKAYDICVPSAVMPFAVTAFTGKKMIIGILPWEEYDSDLYQELKDAWASEISQRDIKTYHVPSASTPGLEYLVTNVSGDYRCTCPARQECWHIKWAKRKEAGELGQY